MKEFTCIICPRGCLLKVDNNVYDVAVTGNACKRGYKYALQEYTNPMRALSVNVRVEGGEYPVVPAKTETEIAQSKVVHTAILTKKLRIKAPVKAGDVLARLFGVNIIATKTVNKVE